MIQNCGIFISLVTEKNLLPMKNYRFLYFIFTFILILSCKKGDDNNTDDNSGKEVPALLSTSGKQVLDANGNQIQLNGVAFSNWHWIEDPLPPSTHHAEMDYTRIKNMGMNVVRFGMNYWIFEDDASPYNYKQTGWDWLDTNIEWAKKNDVYLILNMHTPQGGYQSQGTGDALWNEVENQNRLAALWKAIAERYKNEPQIAGYGVVNEPIPNNSLGQWSQLAQRLINEIRSTGDEHIVIVEQAIEVKGIGIEANLNFPTVTGDNIMYEFHTYEPFQFTHQLMDFSGVGDGGSYPDEKIIELGDAAWETAIFNSPTQNQNADWTYLEGIRYTVEDTNIDIALPVLITGNIGAGAEVRFDDLVINEYDANGTFVQSIKQDVINNEAGWEFWSRNDDGDGGWDTTEGRTDSNCFLISNATDESNLNNRIAAFEPVQGYQYEFSGWVKTEGMIAGGDALLRLDFYNAEGEVQRRNKAYLESFLDGVDAWATAQNAPVYVGEVGTGAPSYENGKGGLVWVEDMVSLLLEKNIHFTFFDYHGGNFGIYDGYFQLPVPGDARQPLVDLFTDLLN